ncbi:MAG: thiamine pyrophosphate-binding protein [Rhodospirillaceae bacterium]|nr:thiamine pyrophosphate-binding protein [Rhodospirillaceae bacterium]
MRGADIVARTLAEAGVRTVFTLSGNQIMPIFDACIDVDIRLVHVRHEAAAVYMADAWAQITGEIGVALVTAAPGFANALSPLFSARGAESPVVLLSGDSPVAQLGHGAFQELEQPDMSARVTKASFRAGADIGFDIARAIRIARSGRPGPVHVALPFDLLNNPVADGVVPQKDRGRDISPMEAGAAQAVLSALAAAKRPLVLTGPMLNASRAGSQVRELADMLDAPVVPLESPRGLRDPSLGMFSDALARADLIVSLGKSVDFTLGFGRPPAVDADCAFFVVDPDDGESERARRLLGEHLSGVVRADADAAVQALIERGPGGSARADWRAEVVEASSVRGANPLPPAPSGAVSSGALCKAVQDVIDAADNPILVCEGGEIGQWAQAFITAPRRIINGPSGAIGGGLSYAIAAKLADPSATVVLVMGDGTAGFHLSEFDTAVRADASIIAVIGNDARWNAEHVIQMRDYGEDRLIGCDLRATRYDAAVAGLGGLGEHVTALADLAPALGRAVASGLPACVNVEIHSHAAPNFVRDGTVPPDARK